MYPAPICCQFSYNMVISDLSHKNKTFLISIGEITHKY